MSGPLTAGRRGGASRLRLLGAVSGLCFAALVGRMLELQIAERPAYAERAEAVRNRVLPVAARPGEILDRRGRVLAATGTAYRVLVDRSLTADDRRAVLERLSPLLGTPPGELEHRAADRRVPSWAPIPVAHDAPPEVVVALRERGGDFSGVHLESHPLRRYPHGPLAAQTLAAASGGVEATCRSRLAGRPGEDHVEVDRRGLPGRRQTVRLPEAGGDVSTTLDLDVQRAAESALADAMAEARRLHPAPAGAVVVLDAADGSVLALASAPAFDPATLSGRVDPAVWNALNDPVGHRPLTNRATQGLYAPGSTFKAITALAGLASGAITPTTIIRDRGSLRVGGRVFRNDKSTAHGAVDLTRALAVSSDVYFYGLGYRLYDREADGPFQTTVRQLGFGRPTGLGIGREAGGLVPGPAARRAAGRSWHPGDAANLSVGQGDLLVTPLQLAAAYGAIAIGGPVDPHLFDPALCADPARVPAGPPADGSAFDPSWRSAVLTGLRAAVATPEGTAAKVFARSPVAVAGKTGTAQVAGKANTALFAGVAPAAAPRYVAVALVEEGGYGSVIAAPLVRRVLEAVPGAGAP